MTGEECIFVAGFCGQSIMMALTQHLILLMQLGSISAGISLLRAVGTGAVFIPDRLLITPSQSEDWCVVCHYCYMSGRTHSF
jgi:hypothetical protein